MAEKNPDSQDELDESSSLETQPSKPKKEETPLWARRSVLDWYSGLGTKGRLIYFGAVLVAFNTVTWFLGFFFPKMLCVGGACLLIGLVISND